MKILHQQKAPYIWKKTTSQQVHLGNSVSMNAEVEAKKFLRRQHQVIRVTSITTQGHKPQSDTSATATLPRSASKLRWNTWKKGKGFAHLELRCVTCLEDWQQLELSHLFQMWNRRSYPRKTSHKNKALDPLYLTVKQTD